MATVKINNPGGGTPVRINDAGGGTPVTINAMERVTPSAPVIIQQSNTTKQIWFEAPQGYKASDCAYKIQGGAEVNATSTIIQFSGDTNLSAGDIEIYVKASVRNFQSASVFNASAFTAEIFLTACTDVSAAAADFYTAGSNGMFLNAAPNSKITTSGTAIKIIFKLAAMPSGITLFWFFIYRRNISGTYDTVASWQLTPKGDFVVGVNELYIPSGFAVQAGDYVGWAHSNNPGLVAMFPRTDDTAPGTHDIYRAATISIASGKDFEAGTSFDTGYYPIILKALP
jgi:hypothetical protein